MSCLVRVGMVHPELRCLAILALQDRPVQKELWLFWRILCTQASTGAQRPRLFVASSLGCVGFFLCHDTATSMFKAGSYSICKLLSICQHRHFEYQTRWLQFVFWSKDSNFLSPWQRLKPAQNAQCLCSQTFGHSHVAFFTCLWPSI